MITGTSNPSCFYSHCRCRIVPPRIYPANSSPVLLLHRLACGIESLGIATFKHASSNPMSCRPSIAAMFVMCAPGLSAGYGVPASMTLFSPVRDPHYFPPGRGIRTMVCGILGTVRTEKQILFTGLWRSFSLGSARQKSKLGTGTLRIYSAVPRNSKLNSGELHEADVRLIMRLRGMK